jgi:hypothetical protein
MSGVEEPHWGLAVDGNIVELELPEVAHEVLTGRHIIQILRPTSDESSSDSFRVRVIRAKGGQIIDEAEAERRVLEMLAGMRAKIGYGSIDEGEGVGAPRLPRATVVPVEVNGRFRYELVVGKLSGEIISATDVTR